MKLVGLHPTNVIILTIYNFHFIFAFKRFFHCGFKYITGSLCLHLHISTKYYPDRGAECFWPFRGSDPFLATRHLFHSKITRIRVCDVGFLVKVLDFCTCLMVNIVTLFLLCLHREFVVKDKKFFEQIMPICTFNSDDL